MIVSWNYHVGGLVAVCVRDTYVFIVSHSGSGLLSLDTGQRLFRDNALNYPDIAGRCLGIGPLAGHHLIVKKLDKAMVSDALALSGQTGPEDKAIVTAIPDSRDVLVGFSSALMRLNSRR